ncbi:NAD(P)/FAD-dependent oxidoreductase [Nocardioides panaciterrulae]|uniref:NADPH-dependent 2,4-dienoyl-CoA reductase/sulfur reductase-like enzyme n=1 Tax=Nocardioides panaciterrulae TaxID=661492 RepID=A0A7Y9E4R4_9ACTN|nr:FAD-dependent oxidoreductase [Nocardioides panaciterrulae]NYD41100.1 NADPH-dependent 2,4-dienoyl-CoA reductase/sulfur reductase-like enzyme [Nocardioides panaciterrulae]
MNIVVVGGGLAGAHAVQELREQGYPGDITLLGEERHLPYERPPLSKGLLLGTEEVQSIFVHDQEWYADQQVDLRVGTSVTALDLDRGRVHVGDHPIAYDRLLLATGAEPRRLPILDALEVPVLCLRTLDDATALKSHLAGRVLIVGAGWIGLEVAAAARRAGADVTVLDTAALPLLAVLGVELAALFADLHREHGVDLRLETSVVEADGSTVTLSDGTRLNPDVVVAGIGATPRDTLAARAGLATGNGVLVDARLRTLDPHVYAAGDVANHDHPTLGRLRVEHWDNAIEQGKHAARAMLGDDQPYDRLPYFFTDQYDLGMEYVGHVGPDGYDEVVVRGDRERRILTAFWVRNDRVVAGMHLNDWDAMDSIRQVVGSPRSQAQETTARP